MKTREKIRNTAFDLFNRDGYEETSVALVCAQAGVSNGSFFHAYPSKDALGADIYLSALQDYHRTMLAALETGPDAAAGIEALIHAHLTWVEKETPKARFLFEQVRSEWQEHLKAEQQAENAGFAEKVGVWRNPLVESGKLADISAPVFFAQLIGPAQMLCRAWLSGRSTDKPSGSALQLIAAAQKALIAD